MKELTKGVQEEPSGFVIFADDVDLVWQYPRDSEKLYLNGDRWKAGWVENE